MYPSGIQFKKRNNVSNVDPTSGAFCELSITNWHSWKICENSLHMLSLRCFAFAWVICPLEKSNTSSLQEGIQKIRSDIHKYYSVSSRIEKYGDVSCLQTELTYPRRVRTILKTSESNARLSQSHLLDAAMYWPEEQWNNILLFSYPSSQHIVRLAYIQLRVL